MATKKPKTTQHIEVPPDTTVEVTTRTFTVPAGTVLPGKRGRKSNVTVLLDADDVVKEQVGGFINFLREHAIVGLAVGFVIGQQAQGVVKQLITSFIDPAFQLFFGNKLSGQEFTLHLGSNHANFGWGGMVYVLLNLLFVLAAIYIIIKVFSLDKLDKPKGKDKSADVKSEAKASKKSVKKS